tara:strand:- start:1045 stop:1509 length:465 start_codon:yes stop_codon:yes gene_type:complete
MAFESDGEQEFDGQVEALKNRLVDAGLMVETFGSGLGAAAFEKGGSFAQGRVMPFAKGGIVTGPTNFPMRGGTGLMGEAGPEAIMPLTRGADGSLGVRAQAGTQKAQQVVVNITTPNVDGFRKSQSQVAAQIGRALGRGQEINQMIIDQHTPAS